jgi:hypothetical protein
MTNFSSINSTFKFEKFLYDIKYVMIPSVGAIANFICIINFLMIIKESNTSIGNMFKYLLVKSICDFFIMILDILLIFCLDENNELYLNYLTQLWFLYFYSYVYYILTAISCYSELLATLDCLFMINQSFELFKKKATFYLVMTLLVVFFIVFYLPVALSRKIIAISPGNYYFITSKFGKSKLVFYHSYLHVLLRDLIPFASLIVINILILFNLKRATQRRRALSSSHQSSSMVDAAEIAERNKVKMLFFTSLIYLLHIPSIFFNLKIFQLNSYPIFVLVVNVGLNLSFCLTIIPYILFNNNFRKNLYKVLCILRQH